jgi:hypothetical protein
MFITVTVDPGVTDSGVMNVNLLMWIVTAWAVLVPAAVPVEGLAMSVIPDIAMPDIPDDVV